MTALPGRDRPLIVQVRRHSLEDGPGIRSVAFFKGCPLRCVFCHNPEAQDPGPEIAFSARTCIACGQCAEACPHGAIDLELPGRIRRERCTRCGRCAEACPTGSLRLVGTFYPVEALAELLLRDMAFYRHSGGGVTLSGGEATLYPDYLEQLLVRLRARGVHIALETSGYFDYRAFRRQILPYLDLVYYDVKLADPAAHRRYTGRSNRRILSNLRRLLEEPGIEVQPRVPLVPGITASGENLAAIVDLLCEAGARSISLLPYNPLGLDAAVKLGRPRPALPERFMEPDQERQLVEQCAQIIAQRREENGHHPGKETP